MIRDTLRAVLAVVLMTVGAGLIVEARYQLACIDVAHRQCIGQACHQPTVYVHPQPPQNTIRRFGRASLELADAALSIIR